MPSYTFEIRKADHVNLNESPDLHVHVYFNKRKSRKCIGRYRLPTLEPVFHSERELNETEVEALKDWLGRSEQIRKLNNCLKDTVFDTHKIAKQISAFGEVITEEGETYLRIRLPVSRRIK